MQTETMNRVIQQVEELTATWSADEKLALAARLTAQANQDNANSKAPSSLAEAATHPKSSQEKSAEPVPYRKPEIEWLIQHDREYAGQYVALLGDRLVAHAATMLELNQLIKASGVERPMITRIKAEDETYYVGW